MSIFGSYLMVDWSARSIPQKGRNSIWYCLLQRGQDAVPRNAATRRSAMAEIRELLLGNVAHGITTLVGFDFAYGFPKGFAAALSLRGEPWLAAWREISRRIQDQDDNSNNRFEVASDLNAVLSGGAFPFWGCPSRFEKSTLWPRRQRQHCEKDLPEYRITDRWLRGPQPVWKLSYAGSVGSQTLLGIPHLMSLRYDDQLSPVSRVWPFEIGLRPPQQRSARKCLIVHAEIYPSIVPAQVPSRGEVKDATQVRSAADYFADLDKAGKLATFFAGPMSLTNEQRSQIESDEGWILGVL